MKCLERKGGRSHMQISAQALMSVKTMKLESLK